MAKQEPYPSHQLSTVNLTRLLTVGGLCGFAWAAGLRGFMSQVAGDEAGVEWVGTFLWILLPGMLTGVLLAWAEYVRRTGGRRHWRWLALSPLLFTAVLIPDPLGVLENGIGGGAIGVPLYGMVGGYAISGRGPRSGRLVAGFVAFSVVPIWALTVESVAPHLTLDTPQGLWVALYYYSFMALLMLACAIPHRPIEQHDARAPRHTADRHLL
ncbi:hypothetical protein E0H75_11995 [Kribbella capetownensis]|uniref:Uncharacterized protein n=1 Tax=Kribbella capetownensis TaxID=1572659 RepID=A0A4R0JZM5_9ACTN|nr:hypothetical protein [Kribbella capetownensis]TCC50876.1 hypothetical protein E0H75_11995 [Kribbella capetownensis]